MPDPSISDVMPEPCPVCGRPGNCCTEVERLRERCGTWEAATKEKVRERDSLLRQNRALRDMLTVRGVSNAAIDGALTAELSDITERDA